MIKKLDEKKKKNTYYGIIEWKLGYSILLGMGNMVFF